MEPVKLGSKNPVNDWKSKMRIRLKKLLPVVLTITFLFNLNSVPANAVADGPVNCGTRGTFTVTSNVVTGNTSCAGDVIIPNGVISIDARAFENNRDITSVTIPDSVTTIGASAFQSAHGLTTLTIGNSVTTIGERAFQSAHGLTTLTIGNSVTTIGDRAFENTFRLTALIIPDSVVTIGSIAFSFAPLTSLTLGNQLTTIDYRAFYRNQLRSVTLPASLTTLGMKVFEDGPIVEVNFLGNAPAIVEPDAFFGIGTGAKANVAYNATGFPANGSTWNRLIVSYGSAPAGDSNSSSPTPVLTIKPKVAKTPDVVFNLKNKKYLSKNAMKTKLSKNKTFKRNPKDLYKYSIFGTSKKTCAIQGNHVTSLKKTGTCDLYATRTTTKGVKYKYWVQINYTK
jgi:hypothetical protein